MEGFGELPECLDDVLELSEVPIVTDGHHDPVAGAVFGVRNFFDQSACGHTKDLSGINMRTYAELKSKSYYHYSPQTDVLWLHERGSLCQVSLRSGAGLLRLGLRHHERHTVVFPRSLRPTKHQG